MRSGAWVPHPARRTRHSASLFRGARQQQQQLVSTFVCSDLSTYLHNNYVVFTYLVLSYIERLLLLLRCLEFHSCR